MVSSPSHKRLEINLGNRTDRVEVGSGAVVLGVVSAQSLVHVGRPQHQKRSRFPTTPGQQLRKHVAKHHAQASLYVLQRQVFSARPAVGPKFRCLSGGDGETSDDGSDHGVDVHRQMVVADVFRQALRQVSSGLGGVLCPHVRRVQNLMSDFLSIGWDPVPWLVADTTHILQDVRVPTLGLGSDELAHGTHNRRCGGGVCTPRQRKEEARETGTTEIVPEPTRRPEGDFFHGIVDSEGSGERHRHSGRIGS
mmetsp:Transcript_21291/g.46345  ORF Transcript_21291/g.46345 Transcript_21291/m.46345 type:complete len:251 (-) Transcript_21291:49-801(-)